jgi:hypothetical protein
MIRLLPMGMESPETAARLMTPTATAKAPVVVGVCLEPHAGLKNREVNMVTVLSEFICRIFSAVAFRMRQPQPLYAPLPRRPRAGVDL